MIGTSHDPKPTKRSGCDVKWGGGGKFFDLEDGFR